MYVKVTSVLQKSNKVKTIIIIIILHNGSILFIYRKFTEILQSFNADIN